MKKETDEDAETARLINELLTRAGMIMEDASVVALLGDSLAGDLDMRIKRLNGWATSILALTTAARVLLDG